MTSSCLDYSLLLVSLSVIIPRVTRVVILATQLLSPSKPLQAPVTPSGPLQYPGFPSLLEDLPVHDSVQTVIKLDLCRPGIAIPSYQGSSSPSGKFQIPSKKLLRQREVPYTLSYRANFSRYQCPSENTDAKGVSRMRDFYIDKPCKIVMQFKSQTPHLNQIWKSFN